MATSYPGDSTIAAPPVVDQNGQGLAYSKFFDSAYSNPPAAGINGDSTAFANQTFAPGQTTPDGLHPLSIQPDAPQPIDATGSQQAMAQPQDNAAMPQGGPLPMDASATPQALNPGDVAGQAQPATPEAAVAQLEQHLQGSLNKVLELGTSGHLMDKPEDQQAFRAALTDLIQTAEVLGAAESSKLGGAPPAAEAAPAPAGQGAGAPPEAAPAPAGESAATPPGAAQTPDGQGSAMPPEAMATGTDVQQQPAVNTSSGPLEANPYEPQVPPSPADAAASQPSFAPGGNAPLDMLQTQLKSQLDQLMSFIGPTFSPSASPDGSPANNGNADNFKTALINIVATAEQIGAKGSQAGQPTQPTQPTQPSSGT